MCTDDLLRGAKYFSFQYWRWLWYRDLVRDRYVFEDAGGAVFRLTEKDIENLSETGWSRERG